MNLFWCTGQGLLRSGLMVQEDIALTLNTEDVELGTTRILMNMSGFFYRAEFLAVVRALEECQPHEVVSDCTGVVKAVQALQQGRRTPKGRHRDLASALARPENQVDESSLETS
eukprot:1905461-Amphidinium_carterae.1